MMAVRHNRAPWLWSGLGLLLTLGIVFVSFARSGGSGGLDLWKQYAPREVCMFHEPALIWLHVISDAVIALAYYSIPVALVYFVRKRRDLTFSWMFVCFAVFILACGTTHVMNIIAMWNAAYRLDGVIKAVTAFVSIATAGVLWPLIPKALAYPSPEMLRQSNDELNREIQERRRAEDTLRQMQAELEQRVRERTADLEATNAQLRNEVDARAAAEQERERLLKREQEARAEAEHASRMKDEFLATLSHELRTPLGAITGWTHLLRNEAATAAELQEGLAVVERNAQAQIQLIDELLDLSRITAGKLRLDRQRVDLGQVARAALESVEPTAETKGVQVVAATTMDGPCVVVGDFGRLQQVVWNLLTNAVKFTPRGGEVHLALSCTTSTIELQVQDNGIGIAPDFLPYVFERFRQADSSTTRQHRGLGIGLTIVRHLVELHGGTVEARSRGLGHGATFSVRLPVPVALPGPERGDGVTGTESSVARRLRGLRVLVVDDEPDSRDILRRLLIRSGAEVYVAESVDSALDQLGAHRPSVIISDIGMPGQDGYALIRQVRRLPPDQGGLTPAIALTAFARAEDSTRALAEGFQIHLGKPVEPAELVSSLERLTARGR